MVSTCYGCDTHIRCNLINIALIKKWQSTWRTLESISYVASHINLGRKEYYYTTTEEAKERVLNYSQLHGEPIQLRDPQSAKEWQPAGTLTISFVTSMASFHH